MRDGFSCAETRMDRATRARTAARVTQRELQARHVLSAARQLQVTRVRPVPMSRSCHPHRRTVSAAATDSCAYALDPVAQPVRGHTSLALERFHALLTRSSRFELTLRLLAGPTLFHRRCLQRQDHNQRSLCPDDGGWTVTLKRRRMAIWPTGVRDSRYFTGGNTRKTQEQFCANLHQLPPRRHAQRDRAH
jgi:hypothetical protein